MMDTLVPDSREIHRNLEERMTRAIGARCDDSHPRDEYPAIDTFLASAARHNAAVTTVVVPAARNHLPDGQRRAREFVTQSRRFELALNQVKAKLYGSSYAVHRSWNSIWADAQREFEDLWRVEERLVADLAEAHQDSDPDWSERLYRAELRAPTRPHPYIPHQGLRGHLARSVAARVDAFWDTAEGRMVPEPVRHHDRAADGPVAQYFLADPHLRDED